MWMLRFIIVNACFRILLILSSLEIKDVKGQEYRPEIEVKHFPARVDLPVEEMDEKLPDHQWESPDFRLEEDPWKAYSETWFLEENRPLRLSPFIKQRDRWLKTRTKSMFTRFHEDIHYLGCYCTTVYKRLTLLAGCAVITTRHILTTATSTELVLRNYRHYGQLEDILGAWYDHNANSYNSSLYMTPCRIHYHPRYTFPHQVNVSHPLPFTFDLAVWTATHTFKGNSLPIFTRCIICVRGGPHKFEISSSTPKRNELAHIVGFQFVKAQRKIPLPWMKYVVRTRDHYIQCPKTEWGWYHCIRGVNVWSKYGVDSGAAWHRQTENNDWRYNGLIGMCAFTMKLRSSRDAHYFTVLNSHPVLDFLYDSYLGRLPYQFLDERFYDSKGYSPVGKGWYYWYFSWAAAIPYGIEEMKSANVLPWY